MMKNKKIIYSVLVIIAFLVIMFFVEKKSDTTQTTISTSVILISEISDLSCNELENLVEIEDNKINYNCIKDSDCTYVNTGWCGSCVNKNTNTEPIENLFNIYNIGAKNGCLPQLECEKVECNKCENNKCVKSYVE